MPKGALVTLLMRDVLGVPYVIAPDILADRQPVSISLEIPKRQLPERIVGFLRGIGLKVQMVDGALFVSKNGLGNGAFPDRAALPGMGSPIDGFGRPFADPERVIQQRAAAVFRPGNVTVAEVNDVLAQLFPQIATSVGGGSIAGAETVTRPRLLKEVFLAGPLIEVENALVVLDRLDQPSQSVRIEAIIAETRDETARASGLSIVADLFGGRLQADTRTGSAQGQTVSIGVLGFSAVLSALKSDGRFTIVSTPSVLVRSGTSATLRAGSQVPTLSGITVSENGQIIRSVEYRESGNTLAVTPSIVGGSINLAISAERSSFAQTDTGVNDSPTLNQTAIDTALVVDPGQTVALAGLTEEINSRRSQGVLGGIFKSKSRAKNRSSLVVFITASLEGSRERVEPVSEILSVYSLPSEFSPGRNLAAPEDRGAASVSERESGNQEPEA